MRKTATAFVLALSAITASALEVGVTAGVNFKQADPYSFGGGCGFIAGPMTCTRGTNREEYGITVGEHFGQLGLKAGVAHSSGGSPVTLPTDGPFKGNGQYRYSVTASYDILKAGPAIVAVTAGGAYLQNSRAADGYATTVGAGIRYPFNKEFSLGLDFARQQGQSVVSQFNGNRVTMNAIYSF
jgi:predicted porin